MKKVFFIIVMTILTLISSANQSKFQVGVEPYSILDSVRVHIDYEHNILFLNFGDFHKRTFIFNSVQKQIFSNCVKFETIGKDETDLIYVNLLLYREGGFLIKVQDVKNKKTSQYRLN